MTKFSKLLVPVTALVGVGSNAFAVTAYDSITAAVNWADVITGITAIAALVAAVLVVKRGSGFLLRMIGR